MEAVIFFGAVLFMFGVFLTWGYTAIVEGAASVMTAQAWLIEQRIKWRLAKHRLSNEQVVEVLLSLDQFTFYMLDGPCTCIRGPDGRHEFVFPHDTLQRAQTETLGAPAACESTPPACEAAQGVPDDHGRVECKPS